MARNKDFNEEEVLCKAVNIFWFKGYHATSMQDLVDGLGINRSSLYDTYGDKHALYVKALAYYREKASGRMIDLIQQAQSAKAAIENLLGLTIADLLCDKQHKGCFMVNAAIETAPHDAEVNAIICGNDADIENAFLMAIQKGQKNAEITTKHDARALARFIFNNVKGIRVLGKSGADKNTYEDIVKLTMSVLE